ncbi:bacteriohemerythrin [Propionispora hippei]|uniref:Hemerythrin-like metal-binding domain protein n=1 Tax=Propionispora hippei DSM 15287 TaxID=1123003 RepID=A0A1M6E3S8_9FIRM|nr:bacteriohemerythrin [Propionispora hippei]SHI80157.1 hemerythrin-like metal-binding domain protein [Propionispora hippei DSM 15287]
MPFIEWNEEMVFQIDDIDAHHEKLVDLINTLYERVFECENLEQERELTGHILRELRDYAVYHFSAEEELLIKCNYPAYREHKREHDQFVSRVGELSEEYSRGEPVLSFPTFMFLKNWLVDHILRKDSDYVAYVKTDTVL